MTPAKEENLSNRLITAANLVLVAAATACLMVSTYCGYAYGWTGHRRFTSWTGVLLYCAVPAALALVLFATLRLRPSRKINLALLLCSTAISLYALEILLTVWFSLPSVRKDEDRKARVELARTAGLDFDTRSVRQVVHDLAGQGAAAIPSIFPQAFLKERKDGSVKSPLSVNGVELLPLGAIADKVVVLCNETGRFLTYRSDQYGFNNPRRLWASAPGGVVAVGDSSVQGYCVDGNMAAVIRERYPSTLNLGMEGNGPLTMLATLKEYTQILQPKVVLWFYFEGNDLRDLNRERKSPLLRNYLTRSFSQNLVARQADIDRALTDYLKTIEHRSELSIKLEELSRLFADVGHHGHRLHGVVKLARTRQRLGLVYGMKGEPGAPVSYEKNEPQMELFYDVLVEAKRSVGEWGGKLYFIYLPAWDRYGATDTNPERDDVLSTATRAGLPVVDIHHAFSRRKDPLALFPFRHRGHYNEEGHRLVAEEILEAIAGTQVR